MRNSLIALALVICLLVIALQPGRSVELYFPIGQMTEGQTIGRMKISSHPLISSSHPLPSTLTLWHDTTDSGDYFSQVKPTKVGYLVWSQFPIRVYVERSTVERSTVESQAQKWTSAVSRAVQEWSVYLPLVVVEQPEIADITIWRSLPPLRISPNGSLPRVRAAETRYQLYISHTSTAPDVLSHRCTIWLSPNQAPQYTQATARHEIGHALGIWGHSPVPTDALYFSQVRNPPLISPRDLNTLKRIYEQPTGLGWPLPSTPLQPAAAAKLEYRVSLAE